MMDNYTSISDLFNVENGFKPHKVIKTTAPSTIDKSAFFIALHAHSSYYLVERNFGYGTCGWWTLTPGKRISFDKPSGTGKKKTKYVLSDKDIEFWAWDPISKRFQCHEWSTFMHGCQWLRYRSIQDGFNDKWKPKEYIKNITIDEPLTSLLSKGWFSSYEGLDDIVYLRFDIDINVDTIIWNQKEKDNQNWIQLFNSLQTDNKRIVDRNEYLVKLHTIFGSFRYDDRSNNHHLDLSISELQTIFFNLSMIEQLVDQQIKLPFEGKWELVYDNYEVNDCSVEWSLIWNNLVQYWSVLCVNKTGSWTRLISLIEKLMLSANIDFIPIKTKIFVDNIIINWSIKDLHAVKPGLQMLNNMFNNFLVKSEDSYSVWSLSAMRDISSYLLLDVDWKRKFQNTSYNIIVINDLSSILTEERLPNFRLAIPHHLLREDKKNELQGYLDRLLNDTDRKELSLYLQSSNNTEWKKQLQEALLSKYRDGGEVVKNIK